MPPPTEEQAAAQQAVEQAIARLLPAYNRESVDDGATPLSWVLVVESVNIGDDGELFMEYTDIFTNHNCRYLNALGILTDALRQIEGKK